MNDTGNYTCLCCLFTSGFQNSNNRMKHQRTHATQLQTSESERSCAACRSLGHAVDFGGAMEHMSAKHGC